MSQIRECTALLLRFAKESGTPVFIIGHVTKEGTVAGPKVLEHLVDTVLYLEGDHNHLYSKKTCSYLTFVNLSSNEKYIGNL